MLTLELIKQAAERIAGRVHRTPVMTSRSFNEVAGCEVFFKCENLQRAGAFKARGATNKILSLTDKEKRRGVIAVSSFNNDNSDVLISRYNGDIAVDFDTHIISISYYTFDLNTSDFNVSTCI